MLHMGRAAALGHLLGPLLSLCTLRILQILFLGRALWCQPTDTFLGELLVGCDEAIREVVGVRPRGDGQGGTGT